MTPFQQKQLDLMRQMEYAFTQNPNASQTVDFQSDYANDPQLFLAYISFLPKTIAQTIQTNILDKLRVIEPDFYYYPDEALHITIQNIRVINDPPHFTNDDIKKAQQLMTDFCGAHGPFEFDLTGLIQMPTSLATIALITPEYNDFVAQLRQKLIDIGIPDDKKYFTDEMVFANCTICRYTHKPSQKFLDEVATLRNELFGVIEINDVSLVTGNAGAHPSKTNILATYQFGKNRG